LFATSCLVCVSILVFTLWQSFFEIGWAALVVTGMMVAVCLLIHAHYQHVSAGLRKLYMELESMPRCGTHPGEVDRTQPVAVVLVSHYGGVGIHTVLNIIRAFPGHFRGFVFVSVGVMDSGLFKGEDSTEDLRRQTEDNLKKYVGLSHGLGLPAEYRLAIGLDPVDEAANLCLRTGKEFPKGVYFAGKVVFRRQRWYQWLLHNDAALSVQRRLQLAGRTVVVMPARVS